MARFIINGGKKLEGTIDISGSKNAVLPILSACLLTKEKCRLENVPDIKDVRTFIEIVETLGAEVSFEKNVIEIQARDLKKSKIPQEYIKQMRASILLLSPLLYRFKNLSIAYPGGCVLGKRPIFSHSYALRKLGAKIIHSDEEIETKCDQFKGKDFIMSEMSVTATENAILAAVVAKGKSIIRLAAYEPHVQDLCKFLVKMGAKIKGIGTHTLEIEGMEKLKGTNHRVTSDYLEAGTMAIAAALTKGHITLKNVESSHLDALWQKLEQIGVKVKIRKNEVEILPAKKLKSIDSLKTSVFPGFPTDLQAPFAVLLTQAEGESQIFETLFENRLNYLFELEKMGAEIKIQGPHRGTITGPRQLKACTVDSCDIRAGAAVVLAALIADGRSEITNINYIDRGYDQIDKKLRKVGADIRRSK